MKANENEQTHEPSAPRHYEGDEVNQRDENLVMELLQAERHADRIRIYADAGMGDKSNEAIAKLYEEEGASATIQACTQLIVERMAKKDADRRSMSIRGEPKTVSCVKPNDSHS
jgi:hypothetical protein